MFINVLLSFPSYPSWPFEGAPSDNNITTLEFSEWLSFKSPIVVFVKSNAADTLVPSPGPGFSFGNVISFISSTRLV